MGSPSRVLRHPQVRHPEPYRRESPSILVSGESSDQANFEDFELSEEDFEAISAAGRAHPVRGNVPAQYTPALWPINIFDTEAEKKFPLKPW